MRVVFMGTPQIAADILREVAQAHQVVGVYTRPDAVRKRGNGVDPSPVKIAALELGLDVFTPSTLRDESEVEALRALKPDVICVVAYGALLRRNVLEAAPFGCLNVHASLLPRWRGAAPIERAILAGDEKTGVCIMRMEEGLDTGPYCKRSECEVGDKSQAELTQELTALGAQDLVAVLDSMEADGILEWVEQPEGDFEYASKIEKGELDLASTDSALTCVRKIRASSEGHASHAKIAGKDVIVYKAVIADDDAALSVSAELEPGQLRFANKRLLLAAQDGVFEVLELKPQGKKQMDAKAFAAGIQGIKNSILNWGSCS